MTVKFVGKEITDKEAAKIREGILKTVEAVEPHKTTTALMGAGGAYREGFTASVADYWLEPFKPSRAQKELKGLSNIQAFISLSALSRMATIYDSVGPYNEKFEDMPPPWQTNRIVEGSNTILSRYTEIKETCKVRLRNTTPLSNFKRLVEGLRATPITDVTDASLKIVLLELADRAVLTPVAGESKDRMIEAAVVKLAGNAAGALEAPAQPRNAGIREEGLAPMFFESVRKMFDHPLFNERAHRS